MSKEKLLDCLVIGYLEQLFSIRSIDYQQGINNIIKLYLSCMIQFIMQCRITKQLTIVLNKMTPETYSKSYTKALNIVNELALSQNEMQFIVNMILDVAVKQPLYVTQYAELCSDLHSYLIQSTMKTCKHQWMLDNNNIDRTYRRMVIQTANDIFVKYKEYAHSNRDIDEEQEEQQMMAFQRKNDFFSMMILMAELYNVGLIKKNLVFKGICDRLLPPTNKNLSEIHLEGLCHLFKKCGKKLYEQGKKYVDKYIQKLLSHARKFDVRTKVLCEEVSALKKNGW